MRVRYADLGFALARVIVRCCVAAMIATLAGQARAAITDLNASVSTTVQELIDGQPGSVSSDSEELNANSSNLPLLASGSLTSTDLEGALASMAQAFSQFSDPTRLAQPNPEEFGLEVACYSNRDSVAYSVEGTADESRTVLFARSGVGGASPEIDFGFSSTATVESRFYLSGAVIFWSKESGTTLDQMLSELSVRVTRDDTGEALFETTLAMIGEGTGAGSPTAGGPIQFATVTLEELRTQGVDDATIAILETVEQNGTLVVLVIPPQEHTYTYAVTADQSLVLHAVLTARVRNIPGGTGVAAALGRPFQNLADFIEHALPGVDGAAIERSVNKATTQRALGVIPPEDSPAGIETSGRRLCGSMGSGGLALLGLSLGLMLVRPRR